MRRNNHHRTLAPLAALAAAAWLALPTVPVSAGAAGTGTAGVVTSVSSVEAPGTFDITATFSITTPFAQGDSVRVAILLQGTDGVVSMGAPVAGGGLTNCDFLIPLRSYQCEIINPASLATYSITVTASATAVPASGKVDVSAIMTQGSPSLNVALSNVEVSITAPVTTNPVDTTVAGGAGALPGTGSTSMPLVVVAALLVAAGGLMAGVRRRMA